MSEPETVEAVARRLFGDPADAPSLYAPEWGRQFRAALAREEAEEAEKLWHNEPSKPEGPAVSAKEGDVHDPRCRKWFDYEQASYRCDRGYGHPGACWDAALGPQPTAPSPVSPMPEEIQRAKDRAVAAQTGGASNSNLLGLLVDSLDSLWSCCLKVEEERERWQRSALSRLTRIVSLADRLQQAEKDRDEWHGLYDISLRKQTAHREKAEELQAQITEAQRRLRRIAAFIRETQ